MTLCLTRVTRRFYSRVMLGLHIPGQYYFITWTSSPQSPSLEKSWNALRQWLHKERPGCSWCYCFTDEGHGVIHMIVRLGKGEKRFNVTRVRAHWSRLHAANQIKIKAIKKDGFKNLAHYLTNQKKLKKMGGELAWQDSITRWRWSKNWIPKGFTAKFGRFWIDWMSAPENIRQYALSTWIQACHEKGEIIPAAGVVHNG